MKKGHSPLGFDWDNDGMDNRTKLDLLDPFMETNDSSLRSEEALDFAHIPRNKELTVPKPSAVDVDSRKRDAASQSSEPSGTMNRRKKKPKGMPKRPLSAYNLFFQAERSNILELAKETGERIGFEGLGKIIGKKWKELSAEDRKLFDKRAETDLARYRNEMEQYNDLKLKRAEEEEEKAASPSTTTSSTPVEGEVPKEDSSTKSILVVESASDGPAISSREEFSRIHHMTAPSNNGIQYLYSSTASDRPPVDVVPPPSQDTMYRRPQSGSYAVFAQPMPPPMEGIQVANAVQMPPGMEIILSDKNGQDRKYRVQYTCYSMSQEDAHRYIQSMGCVKQEGPGMSSSPAPPQSHVPYYQEGPGG